MKYSELNSLLKEIDKTLLSWENTKLGYGISQATIESGNQILSYEKWKKNNG